MMDDGFVVRLMLREDAASLVYQKSGISQDLQFSMGVGVRL